MIDRLDSGDWRHRRGNGYILNYMYITIRVNYTDFGHQQFLVVGVGGLGAELCKNIVLAGVKSVTLLDNNALSSSDLGNRFLAHKNGENVSFNIFSFVIIMLF